MSPRAAARLGWSLWALAALLTAVTLGLAILEGGSEKLARVAEVAVGASLPPITVGAIVASRRSEHPIGWMLLVMGLLWAVVGVTAEYAHYTLVVQPGVVPGGAAVGWISSWSFALPVWLLGLIVLVFPTGRLPSPRWRPIAWLLGIGLLLKVVPTALAPGPLSIGLETMPVENPLGFQPMGLVADWFWFWPFVLTLPPVAAVAWRFRSAPSIERLQLKWFLYAAVAVPLVAPVSFNFNFSSLDPGLPSVPSVILGGVLWGLTVSGVPLAIGIAVLRYRLYDIDVIIRRTLVYGVLTALLALAYWASVVILQQVLRPLTQGSDLAIVGSTLAVAAMFQPLRQRIQLVVDRRFYRQRYDALRTLESFSARLRDEVDLDSLGAELLTVVGQTMQPQRISLWLRPPTARKP